MRRLEIHQISEIVRELRRDGGRSTRSRYLHRLHCVRLVGAGVSCYAVAAMFGDHPRTIERWVRRFQCEGVDGLHERARAGRRAALDPEQMAALGVAVGDLEVAGDRSAIWDGRSLQQEICARFAVALSRRQCRRLLRELRTTPLDSRAGTDAADPASVRTADRRAQERPSIRM